jgi:multicomponent Na+:H+ antiporter subunit G
MSGLEWVSAALLAIGALFFVAGTAGLLRFPDVFTRLHALTKADNLGLGLITVALMLQADSVFHAAKLLLVWMMVLFSSSLGAYLVAHAATRDGVKPWRKKP